MQHLLFRKIAADEIDIVHGIYNEVFDWLKAKSIRQWLTPKSREFFEDFRRKDRLYGLFAGDGLAAFAALSPEMPPHWAGETDIAGGAWVHRLTLNPRLRGQGIGALLVRHLIALARENGASHICLDAVDNEGVMPAYYENCGFQRRKAAAVTYPNGNTFPVVFLDMRLSAPEATPARRLRGCGYEAPQF
ncbi:MAG TPA: GNAT family N-acetyltransferase [Alphaproteobacteria bacterium]|nr:GNAT family N-acetyltransferase [Alphaproteobacteria bacterium]